MEDRTLPSTVTWISGNDDWDTAADWSTGMVRVKQEFTWDVKASRLVEFYRATVNATGSDAVQANHRAAGGRRGALLQPTSAPARAT